MLYIEKDWRSFLNIWKGKLISPSGRYSELFAYLFHEKIVNVIVHWNYSCVTIVHVLELCMAASLTACRVAMEGSEMFEKFFFFHAFTVNLLRNTFRPWYSSFKFSLRHSIARRMASFMFFISSSRLSPWLKASGNWTHWPQYQPVEGFFSIMMLYSIYMFFSEMQKYYFFVFLTAE